MSLVFSATSSPYNGIIQRAEVILFGDTGLTRISGNTDLLAIMTTEANLANNYAQQLIIQAEGTWQFDDSNHTDYPTITTNLVASQRDYPFTTDENGNLILDVYKVMVADSNGLFSEVKPVDQQSDSDMSAFWDGNNLTGTPDRYDKTANAIFLDPIPSYSYTNGLKLFISREHDIFTTADTTQKPGFSALFHDYIPLRMAWQYAWRNGLASAGAIRDEMLRMEREMVNYYARRSKDEVTILKPEPIVYE